MIIIVISYLYSAINMWIFFITYMIKDRIGLTSLSPITIINCHFCIGNFKKIGYMYLLSLNGEKLLILFDVDVQRHAKVLSPTRMDDTFVVISFQEK